MDEKGHADFPPTRPSALLALHSGDPAVRRRSLGRLSQMYWGAVYKYLRLRWRKAPADAEDLAQEFFLRCIAAETFHAYDPERARFRTFLRVCLDRFVLDQSRRSRRKRRGHGWLAVTVDVESLEREIGDVRDARVERPASDPDSLFRDEWVRSLVAMAAESLRAHCQERGKQEHFRAFELYYLAHDGELSYPALAEALGISRHDVTNRLAYARREFRRIVLETLRDFTSSEHEWRCEAQLVLGVELDPAAS